MEEISEQELIQMVNNPRTRDTGFRLLYDRYHRKLYGYIRKIVLTHENADDVLQNTLMKVYKNIAGFRGDSSLKNWIFRIAHNEALQLLRKNKRQATSYADGIKDCILHADPYFRGDTVHELLLEAIASLPDRQRQVFELRYFADFKYKDIATDLQVTEGALKASYHHAVLKITEYVKENTPPQ